VCREGEVSYREKEKLRVERTKQEPEDKTGGRKRRYPRGKRSSDTGKDL